MQEPTELISIYEHCKEFEKNYFMVGNAKIIYKKGGGISMVKRVAKEGMQDLFDLVNEKISNLNAEKDEAIRLVTDKVNEDFAERERIYNDMLEATSEEIEIPEPEQEDNEVNDEINAEEIETQSEEELI